MLRPERMARAVIVGPREQLSPVIETLYEMKLIHLLDYRGEDDTFHLGKPLPPAAALSEDLVKLRSIASILSVKAPREEPEEVEIEHLREKVLSLELNIREEDEARKKAESLVGDLDRRIEELRPFASLGLPLETYRGYETVAPLVGRIAREVSDSDLEGIPVEIFRAPGVVAVFTTTAAVERVQAILGRFGFAQLEIPIGEGSPGDLLDAALADHRKWTQRLEEIQARLDILREKYGAFVVASEEALEIEVDKAEVPLRFAVSDHTFVIDGWVPDTRFEGLRRKLDVQRIFVERETSHGDHEEVEPPVLLRNPRPAKPFEFLIHLYSTPNYRELDPTLFLFIAAPFLFGFMIGDVGYGALFMALGIFALARLRPGSIWFRIYFVTAVGGVWSVLLGLFVFGEAFGLPFHPAPGHLEELSWEHFGIFIPIQTLIHKAFGIGDMIYLSILFAAFHLGFGYVFGFVNEMGHDKKHALAKLGWLACLFGLFTLLTFSVATRGNRIALWVWDIPLSWFPRTIQVELSAFVGLPIPVASLILIFGAFLGLTESIIAPIEIASLLANVMSYARLAGIGIGKAAIAAAFNAAILEGFVLSGQVVLMIVGIVLLIMAQLLVFFLGWISAGIQALRLNYVEAFLKFYKGNGTPFRPFGVRGTQEA